MNKVKCPKCGSEQIVALENRPDELDYDVIKLGLKELPHSRNHIYAGVVGNDRYYTIARCLNDECRVDYLVERKYHDDPWKVQPFNLSSERIGEGVPPQIDEAYRQAKACLTMGCPDASIAMCRASLDRMSKEKKAEGATLAARLDDLTKKGILKASVVTEAINIKNFGNTALHDLLVKDINNEDAEIICDFTKGILTDIYVTPELALKATRRISEVKNGKAQKE